ncbi:MAG: lytic transglycosylase domain-containing protein [Xanthobacteraceae bacterium]
MRAILVFTILLLGLAGAAPEPEYSFFGGGIRADRGALDGLVEIESSTHRGDRLSLAALGPRVLRVEILRPEARDAPLRLASLNSDVDLDGANTQGDAQTTLPQPTALDNLCNTLLTSAQDNDLPVPFFANLLWQESRLRVDDISKKGAQGIAQFMPKTAIETGLADPFDPMQAIPASARFLQRLRLQFGNLGFVAAAYNAGAHRVIEWLERRASLPRETRDYVVRVTGLSVEAWKSMPIDNAALTFVPHLPCRSLPAFANVEQEQMQQTDLERAKRAPAANEEISSRDTAVEPVIPAAAQQAGRSKHERVREARRLAHEKESSKRASKHETKQALSRVAREEHGSKHEAKHEASRTAREGRASKHEAAHAPRGGRERRRSA